MNILVSAVSIVVINYMKLFFPLIFLICFNHGELVIKQNRSHAETIDYRQYHDSIISAEEKIFLLNRPIEGLLQFNEVFNNYEFAYVDDCIEAFQLAIYFKRNDLALVFIKKAISNGFKIEYLAYLTLGCPCNFYKDMEEKVTIFDDFIRDQKEVLSEFTRTTQIEYQKRLNISLIKAIAYRHTKEQLFKNYVPDLGYTMERQMELYKEISTDNLRFIDSLAQAGVFVGERNLGIINDDLLIDNIPLMSYTKQKVCKQFHLPNDQKIPIVNESDYFNAKMTYYMFYHNPNSYALLKKHQQKAVSGGYLHPREFLALSGNKKTGRDKLQLLKKNNWKGNREFVNSLRRDNNLPTIEIDSAKHAFAHQHQLQLTFGFFNSTR